jgi:hypothetical protein
MTQEFDRWPLENREEISAKIRRGIDQLDRGEGVPDDRLDAYLAQPKAEPDWEAREPATYSASTTHNGSPPSE